MNSNKPVFIAIAFVAGLWTIGAAAAEKPSSTPAPKSKGDAMPSEELSFNYTKVGASKSKGAGQNQIQLNDTAGAQKSGKSNQAPVDDIAQKKKSQQLPAVQKMRDAPNRNRSDTK